MFNKNKDVSSQENQTGHKSPQKIRVLGTVLLEAETTLKR